MKMTTNHTPTVEIHFKDQGFILVNQSFPDMDRARSYVARMAAIYPQTDYCCDWQHAGRNKIEVY